MRKLLAAALVGAVVLLGFPSPAFAHTAQLGNCPTNTPPPGQHIPATRDLGNSSNWGSVYGFRSCKTATSGNDSGPRGTIWFKCWSGNGIEPKINIMNTSTGVIVHNSISACDNAWKSWNSGVAGWPSGTNSHRYLVEVELMDVEFWYDAQFAGASIRWNDNP